MQPQKYLRQVDFTDRSGDDTDHAGINQELDAAATSINQIRDNLTQIQRDDGGLKNQVVTADALAPSAFDAVQASVNAATVAAQTAATSANNAANSANAARDAAIVAKTGSETARDASVLNANNAAASAASALSSKNAAATSETNALASKNAAASSETNAAASATSATNSANTATTQAGIATTKAGEAAASKTAAETAAATATTKASEASASATDALASKNAAQTSATIASASATTATTKASEASASAADALTSKNAAAASQADALVSKNAAAASQADALASKNAAATSEAKALTYKNSAQTSATSATGSANAAAASAVDAANSAAAAATALDNFDDRYLGAKTADPSVDNDGNPLQLGALYTNTVTSKMRIYTSLGWVDASSAAVAALTTYEYVATAGQTVFSGNDANGVSLTYTAGGLIVTVNGSRLRPGDDYTATNGTSITLTAACVVGDEVVIDAFGNFTVADTYSRAQADALLAAKANQSTTYTKTEVDTALAGKQAADANLTSVANLGLFKKADSTIPAFTKTGAGTMTTSQALYVEVNGSIKTIAASTSITMPTLTAGTDYAIWAKTDGTLEATSNHTSPPTANARKVGGFHYAAGGNATGTSGGNTTAQINEYSIWDLKFRPVATDPRGMALVAGGFWMDIYLTGVDAITNGSSKYNVTIADGSSPPKISSLFGGNGSTTYGSYTWFEAAELASSFQKRLPTQREFMAAGYGTTEASAIGSDQGSTVLNADYTSKWGIIQSTGVMWIWGDDRGGPYAGASWNANTEGRGSEYNAPNAVVLGGAWNAGAYCGSRCSGWNGAASTSGNNVGSRFACDHLQLD